MISVSHHAICAAPDARADDRAVLERNPEIEIVALEVRIAYLAAS